MNKMLYTTLVAISLISNSPTQAKLSQSALLMVSGAAACSTSNVSTGLSIISPNTYADYAPHIMGMTDCQALQFIIQNKLTMSGTELRPVTLTYLLVKNYTKQNGNFDNCNLGFDLDSTSNTFIAPVALFFSDFTGSSMRSVNFSNDFLCGANFTNITGTSAIFDGVDAPGVIFTGANLAGASFQHAYMPQSYFNNTTTGQQTVLSNAQFIQTVLFQTTFENAQVNDAEFFFCDMHKVNLKNTNCSGSDFNHCFGTLTVTTATNFTNAKFNRTDRLYMDIPEGQSPIFNNTLMPDGELCTGPSCVKHFIRVEEELPSNAN